MSDSYVELMWSWAEQLGLSDDPLNFWYENIWDRDVDHRAIEGAPDDVGPILGRDAMRRYYGEWYELFDDLVAVVEEVIDARDGVIVTVLHVSGRAKASGAPVDMRVANVYTIRDGRIVRGREYLTREEALKAAGLAD
jgi:ketosteroid isomerase-like protein